jgi:hypothetical protein
MVAKGGTSRSFVRTTSAAVTRNNTASPRCFCASANRVRCPPHPIVSYASQNQPLRRLGLRSSNPTCDSPFQFACEVNPPARRAPAKSSSISNGYGSAEAARPTGSHAKWFRSAEGPCRARGGTRLFAGPSCLGSGGGDAGPTDEGAMNARSWRSASTIGRSWFSRLGASARELRSRLAPNRALPRTDLRSARRSRAARLRPVDPAPKPRCLKARSSARSGT